MTEESKKYTVVIADDHEIIREGIRTRVERDCTTDVIGEASDGYSSIKICRQLKPDILMMDYEITRPNGREVLRKIAASCPDVSIIVFTSEISVSTAHFVLGLGAVGLLPKQASGADFVNAINAAVRGYTYIPGAVVREFFESRRNIMRTGNAFGLSPREIEIMEACLSGLSTQEVAENLRISVRTVETHRSNIYRKTACRNFEDLAMILQERATESIVNS